MIHHPTEVQPGRRADGLPAPDPGALPELRRALRSCLLWELNFREEGDPILDRIERLAERCEARDVAALAIEARRESGLQVAPLVLCLGLCRLSQGSAYPSEVMAHVLTRASDLPLIVALAWRNGKRPIPKQVKKALAAAFNSLPPIELSMADGAGGVTIRDVLFMVHARPTAERERLFSEMAETRGQLARREHGIVVDDRVRSDLADHGTCLVGETALSLPWRFHEHHPCPLNERRLAALGRKLAHIVQDLDREPRIFIDGDEISITGGAAALPAFLPAYYWDRAGPKETPATGAHHVHRLIRIHDGWCPLPVTPVSATHIYDLRLWRRERAVRYTLESIEVDGWSEATAEFMAAVEPGLPTSGADW